MLRRIISSSISAILLIIACSDTAVPTKKRRGRVLSVAQPGAHNPVVSADANDSNTAPAPDGITAPDLNKDPLRESQPLSDGASPKAIGSEGDKETKIKKTLASTLDYPRIGGTDLTVLGHTLTAASPKASPKVSPKAALVNTIDPVAALPVSLKFDEIDQIPFELIPKGADPCMKAMENQGIYAITLWTTCTLSHYLRNRLYGPKNGDYNGDGIPECSDITEATTPVGLLPQTFCSRDLNNFDNLVSIGFDPLNTATAKIDSLFGRTRVFDFRNFDGGIQETKGYWDQNDANSFPLKMRVWQSQANAVGIDNLDVPIAIDLEHMFKGTLWSLGTSFLDDLQMKVEVDTVNTALACRQTPTLENCNYQEFQIYAGNGVVAYESEFFNYTMPNSMYYRVISDYTLAPSLIVIEGKFEFVAASAVALFSQFSIEGLAKRDLSDVRTIYFRVIQENDEIWRSTKFLDADGINIPLLIANDTFGNLADPNDVVNDANYTVSDVGLTVYQAGQCRKTNESDNGGCSSLIDPLDFYGHLFSGIHNLNTVDPTQAMTIPFKRDDAPATLDAVTTQGIFTHEPWGQAPVL